MTRRPEGTRISVRIPDDVLADIDRRADAQGLSRAAVIRDLLRQGTR